RDITERKRMEEALAWEANANAALAEVSKVLLTATSIEEISDLILAHARDLTGSTVGYAGYIDPETGYLICPTMSREVWEHCNVPDKDIVFEVFGGLWGWVLENRESLMTNNLVQDPRSTGLPHGHIQIHRFLSAPALAGEDLVGQLALANPDRDYTARDVELVERLASLYALAVQRQRMEKVVVESEARFRLLAENAQDEIYRIALAPELRFEYVSPAATEITGYTPEEHYADPSLGFKLVHPDDRHLLEGMADSGEVPDHPIVLRWVRKDGTILWTEQQNTPIFDEEGNVVAIEGIARDITERKRAEDQLQQYATNLEQSNQELQQFAHVASHDLREPLRMVRSYVQLLERRYGDQLDDTAREYIDFAVDGVIRMEELIRGLLLYSRIDTGDGDAEVGPVDCEAVLAQTLANLKVVIEERSAQITHDPLPTVGGSEIQIRRLFQNLIDNAIKFTNGQRPLVHISAERRGEAWLFSVRDNGIGLDPAFKDHIFVIFQRLHSRDAYPGTGIGLAICRKIVERHGGRIWVESEPGEGATFYFTLPASDKDLTAEVWEGKEG
ncbi:MAG: sensor histidine kinase, partial [Anaerolineae bacterium]